MLKVINYYTCSGEEKFNLEWNHLVHAMLYANKAKNNYEKYISAKEQAQISLGDNMLITSIVLSKLGYPMDAFGTYLYAEIIAKAISEFERKEDKEKIKQVQNQITQQSDHFFLPLLKDKLDIREKDFKENVRDAINLVDVSKMDISLVNSVYDGISNPLDPLENAVVIADYIYTKKNQKESFKTKKLVSMHK